MNNAHTYTVTFRDPETFQIVEMTVDADNLANGVMQATRDLILEGSHPHHRMYVYEVVTRR